jgi:hypothetical protein
MDDQIRNNWDAYCRALSRIRVLLENDELRTVFGSDSPDISSYRGGEKVTVRWFLSTPYFFKDDRKREDFETDEHYALAKTYQQECQHKHDAAIEALKGRMITLTRLLPGKVTKQYVGGSFSLSADVGDGIIFHVACEREAVCTKRVVGKHHIEAHLVPAHDEEQVEWDCHPLLAS